MLFSSEETLYTNDFATAKSEKLVDGVSDFALSRNNHVLLYCSHHRLRVLKAGEKPKSKQKEASRETGWLDLAYQGLRRSTCGMEADVC